MKHKSLETVERERERERERGNLERQRKKESGITLVALIITIIVLIILAAVTVIAVQNTNLVSRAQNAAIDYSAAQKQEDKDMQNLDERLENVIGKIGAGGGRNGSRNANR